MRKVTEPNVILSVTHMGRSVAFYEKLCGPSIKQGDLAVFRLARSRRFFGVTPVKAGEKPGFVPDNLGMQIQDVSYCGGSGRTVRFVRNIRGLRQRGARSNVCRVSTATPPLLRLGEA